MDVEFKEKDGSSNEKIDSLNTIIRKLKGENTRLKYQLKEISEVKTMSKKQKSSLKKESKEKLAKKVVKLDKVNKKLKKKVNVLENETIVGLDKKVSKLEKQVEDLKSENLIKESEKMTNLKYTVVNLKKKIKKLEAGEGTKSPVTIKKFDLGQSGSLKKAKKRIRMYEKKLEVLKIRNDRLSKIKIEYDKIKSERGVFEQERKFFQECKDLTEEKIDKIKLSTHFQEKMKEILLDFHDKTQNNEKQLEKKILLLEKKILLNNKRKRDYVEEDTLAVLGVDITESQIDDELVYLREYKEMDEKLTILEGNYSRDKERLDILEKEEKLRTDRKKSFSLDLADERFVEKEVIAKMEADHNELVEKLNNEKNAMNEQLGEMEKIITEQEKKLQDILHLDEENAVVINYNLKEKLMKQSVVIEGLKIKIKKLKEGHKIEKEKVTSLSNEKEKLSGELKTLETTVNGLSKEKEHLEQFDPKRYNKKNNPVRMPKYYNEFISQRRSWIKDSVGESVMRSNNAPGKHSNPVMFSDFNIPKKKHSFNKTPRVLNPPFICQYLK